MNNTSMMLTSILQFALLVTTIVGLPKSTGRQGSPEAKRSESPFACNRLALTPERRKRHFDELGPKLRLLKKSVRELPNGYEFEFPADSNTVQLVAEWAVGERA